MGPLPRQLFEKEHSGKWRDFHDRLTRDADAEFDTEPEAAGEYCWTELQHGFRVRRASMRTWIAPTIRAGRSGGLPASVIADIDAVVAKAGT
jgi:hypothetical protein